MPRAALLLLLGFCGAAFALYCPAPGKAGAPLKEGS
jgi:hypothetical protein